MGKIVGLLLLTLVFTISLDFTSGIDDPEGFDRLMQRVIRIFRGWAKSKKKEQFAVILMMDKKSAWDDFEFQPTAMTVHTKTSRISPDLSGESFAPRNPDLNSNRYEQSNSNKRTEQAPTKNRLANYIAALPKRKLNEHSEERLLPGLLKRLDLAYRKKYKKVPDKIIFYSWAVPCWNRHAENKKSTSCSSECKSDTKSKENEGCTHLIKEKFEDYVTHGKQVVLAYSTLGGGMKHCECIEHETRNEFSKSKIEVVRVHYRAPKLFESSSMEDLEEVMIEGILDVLLEE